MVLLQELANTHTELLAASLTQFLGVLHVARLSRTCRAAHEMMFHEEAWRVRVLGSCWWHLRPDPPVEGEELARMWLAAGLHMCWRDLYFAASSVNLFRQFWIKGGDISLTVQACKRAEAVERKVTFKVIGTELTTMPVRVNGDPTVPFWRRERIDLRKGHPGVDSGGRHVMNVRVDASIDSQDPCCFHVPFSECDFGHRKYRADTAEQAAALVEKINVTGKLVHEDMGSFDESIAERTLYEQEGWGGDDSHSFSRLFDAAAAFGIEWQRPKFFAEPGMAGNVD